MQNLSSIRRKLSMLLALLLILSILPIAPPVVLAAEIVSYPQFFMAATACTQETANEGGRLAVHAIDGNSGTFWHTSWGSPNDNTAHTNSSKVGIQNGHWFQVDLGGNQTVSSITYQPRQDGNSNGIVTSVRIYVSSDGTNFTQVSSGAWTTWANDATTKTLAFTPTVARYVLLNANAPTAYVNCAEFNVQVEDVNNRAPAWEYAQAAIAKIRKEIIDTTPGTYPTAAQTTAINTIIAAAQVTADTYEQTVAIVDAAVEVFYASLIHYTKEQLLTLINTANTNRAAATVGTADGNVFQADYNIFTAAIAAAQAVYDSATATGWDIDDVYPMLVDAIAAFKAAVITATPTLTDGKLPAYDLAVNLNPDAIRFNNLEWTGAASVTTGLPNQGRQSLVYEVNREKARAFAFGYQNVAAAKKGTEDYDMEKSDYYMPLTTAKDLDPLTSDWTFSIVRSLTTTLATANSTKDPLNPSQNIVEFYKPAYDASNWPGHAVPSSWCVQGVGADNKPYTGYYDPAYGYDPPYYTNISMPGSVTWKGTSYAIFNSITMPGAPNVYNPVGFYRRSFDVPEQWITDKNKVFITLNAVEAAYYLYLNGKEVGYFEDSKMPGEFDLTPFLTADGKNNLLAIKVFRWADSSWMDDQDFLRHGGIARDIYLTATPALHIRDFKVETKFDASYTNATLSLRADVRNYAATQNLTNFGIIAQLIGPDGVDTLNNHTIKLNVDVNANSEVRVTGETTVAQPHKWFPDDPYLYTLVLSLYDKATGVAVERVASQFGFSQVTFRTASNTTDIIRLNGQKVVFFGVNRHDNTPWAGRYVPKETYIQDLQIMKRHNVNSIRTSHYPNDPYLYYLANKMGFMLCAEANAESHANSSTLLPANFQDMVISRELNNIETYKNLPSIVMWSVGNETSQASYWRNPIIPAMRAADSTHPIHSCDVGDISGTNLTNNPDMSSSMYASVEGYEGRCSSATAASIFECEYAHAMGNSVGNLKEYTDVFRRNRRAIGGCIWEWADHTIWTKPTTPMKMIGSDLGPSNSEGNIPSGFSMPTVNNLRCIGPAQVVTYDDMTAILNEKCSGSQPFSVEAFISYTGTPSFSQSRIFGKGDTQFALKFTNGGDLEFCVDSSWKSTSGAKPANLNNGAIHHIVGTYDGSNVRLYCDGTQVGTAVACTSVSQSTYALATGTDMQNTGRVSICNLYGARVWSRVLDSSERSSAFATGVPAGSGLLFCADYSQSNTNLRVENTPVEMFDIYGNGMYLAYGGDWGEGNNDDNFCADGLLMGDRTPYPAMSEVKKCYQAVNFVASESNLKNGVVHVRNEYYARNVNKYDFKWELTENGTVISGGTLDPQNIPAPKNHDILVDVPTQAVSIPYLAAMPGIIKPGTEYFLNLSLCLRADSVPASQGSVKDVYGVDSGYALITEQFKLPVSPADKAPVLNANTSPLRVTVNDNNNFTVAGGDFTVNFERVRGLINNFTVGGEKLLIEGPRPTFNRPHMDNDNSATQTAAGWINMDQDANIPRPAFSFTSDPKGLWVKVNFTYNYTAVSATTYYDMSYTIYLNGAIRVDTNMRTTNTGTLRSYGADLTMPYGFENVTWLTRGPQENLWDRKTGYDIGVYQTTVSDNFWPYMRPQNTGTHGETRWMAVTGVDKEMGLLISAAVPPSNVVPNVVNGIFFEANALHFNWRDLSSTRPASSPRRHPFELRPRAETIVSVNYGSTGTGGSSCGPQTRAEYILKAGNNKGYSYTLIPFATATPVETLQDLALQYRNMNLENLEWDISIDNRLEITPVSVEPNSPGFKLTAKEAVSGNVIVASYDADGRLAGIDAKPFALAKDEKVTLQPMVPVLTGGTYRFFVWDAAYIPMTAITSVTDLP